MIYNPHPYPVHATIQHELQSLEDFRYQFPGGAVFCGDRQLPTQLEKPANTGYYPHWRKLVVFDAELQPSRMNRSDLKIMPKAKPVEHPIQHTDMVLPAFEMRQKVSLKPFEIRTFRINPTEETWTRVNLVEE